MAKIMRNGQVWSQTSYYKDIEEKPTINGHKLLETNNTSASLEIFKNITKAEYEDPDFEPNYQTVYAVHDEEGNFRIHFWNQTEDPTVLEPIEYILEDYREVLELPADEKADSTVLYYLKKDWTNPDTDVLYKKGLWGWVDVSEVPGVQDFKWILFTQTPVDEKTIYNNELGEASTQVGGYLLDDVETTKVMVVNKQDAFELQVDEEAKLNTVKFPYSNYNAYTPNTMYKITFKYGDQMPKTFETDSKLLDGVKIGEFGKLTFTDEYLYVVLDSTVYDSDDLADYNLTVEWQKPDKVSAINPLFFPVDESLTINNKGELGVGSVKNGWQSIHKIEDYLYQTYFSGMDYFYAEEYFKSMNTTAGFCSTVRSGNFIGRNHDQVYSELAEFIVETPNRTGRYATVGIAGGIEELTKEKVESGDYVKASRVVPFMVFDGMNEKGVVASINKVPCDKEPTTITEPDIEAKKTLCGYQLPRFVLDNFATAREGAEFIRDYVAVYMTDALQEEGYELNLMISDKDESFVIEFIDNENNLMNAIAAPYCTNFFVTDMTPNVDRSVYTPADVPTHTPSVDNNITEHGKGLERYNLINRSVNPLTPYTAVAQMRLLMRQLCYTNTYTGIGGADPWVSEFTGVGDITVDTPAADIIADTGVQDIITKYLNRSRDPLDGDYGTLHTSHTSIYDVINKTIIVSVQEGTTEYMFALPQEEGVDGEMFIGPISDVSIDSSQNAILQTILDGIFNENKAYVLNYNNQEKLLTSSTTLYDDYGAYLPFSGVIHNSYTLLRVYYDEPTKLVMGAKRYDITPVRYQLEDIPEGSPLATNCAVCVCDDYRKITFSSPDPFHIGTVMGWKGDGGVQYSYNKKDWFDWDGTTVLDANVRNMYGVYDIHFRGVENTYLYKSETEYTAFKVTMDESVSDKHNVEVRGNCVYMLDFNTDVPETLDNIFRKLFSGGVALEQSKSLVLPFTSLGNHSYQDMFKGCTYLTNCPQIPAIETKIESCDGMFDGCTNLIEPPTLPATVLGEGCYRNMFRNCASITEAPLLEAMVLSEYCYEGMFEGCISLEECPELPAVMLPVPKGAYKNMFKNCKGITKTPVLEAVIIGDEAYYGMFSGTLITEFTGKLKAMTLGVSAYESMFQACTKLTKMPELPAKKASKRCYANMFYGCTALVDLIDLPMDVVAEECCLQMFMNCTALIDPLELPAKTLAPSCYRSMFEGCKAINWYPAGHPYKVPCTGIGTSAANAMTNMFKGNTARASGSIPGGGTPVVNTVYYCRPRKNEYLTFEAPGAFTLINAWSGNVNILYSRDNGKLWDQWGGGYTLNSALLPDESTNDNVNKLYICGRITDPAKDYPIRGYSGNQNVKVYGKIKYMSSIHEDDWKAEIPPVFNYRALFYQNTYLIDASGLELIDNLTSPHCYRSMFCGCTRLSLPPTLPKNVSIAHEYSHYQMFRDCDSLTKMDDQVLPAETVNQYAYAYMFYDCDNLLTPILELPGGLEGGYEYYYMYYSCDRLKYASEIKAKIFNVNSCRDTFGYCAALTECQEEIPVAAFTGNYSLCRMFENTALTKAPKLPAMELGGYCYDNMFNNCKSLVEPPELPATVMAPYCYNGMFSGCTKLATCPELPSMELAIGCYTYMCNGCTSIKRPVNLPAIKMVQNCYSYMYNGCTGIIWFPRYGEPYRIPSVGTGTAATDWNTAMFAGNSSRGGAASSFAPTLNGIYYLKPIEWVTFSAPNEFNTTFNSSASASVYSVDGGETWTNAAGKTVKSSLQNDLLVCGTQYYAITQTGGSNQIKVKGKAWQLSQDNFGLHSSNLGLFYNNTALYDASELILPAYWNNATSGNHPNYSCMFYGCTSLTKAPKIPEMWDYNIERGMHGMFYRTTSLKTPPAEIPVTCTAERNGVFAEMFRYSGIESAPKIYLGILYTSMYGWTFRDCKSLKTPPEVEIKTSITNAGRCTGSSVADFCFADSTALEKGMDLTGINLNGTTNCFQYFYQNCSSLKEASLPYGNLGSYCYRYMFQNCTSLENLPQVQNSNRAPWCFQCMFNQTGVKDLRNYDLSCLNLAEGCYNSMFINCKELIHPPAELPALSIPSAAYQNMFYNCVRLRYCPDVKGYSAYSSAYRAMFMYCYSLTKPAEIKHTSDATARNNLFFDLYNQCPNIAFDGTSNYGDGGTFRPAFMGSYSTIEDGAFGSMLATGGPGAPGTPSASQVYYVRNFATFSAPAPFTTLVPPGYAFSTDDDQMKWTTVTTAMGTTSVTSNANNKLYLKWMRVNGSSGSSLRPVDTTGEYSIVQVGGNNKIKVEGDYASLCGNGSGSLLFYNNTALYDASCFWVGNANQNNACDGMFWGCKSLKLTPKLPNLGYSYICRNMFRECTSLETAPALIGNPGIAACSRIFSGCTSLKKAPPITGTQFNGTYCFEFAFENCVSLKAPAPMNFTGEYTNYCLRYMYRNCTGIVWSTPAEALAGRASPFTFWEGTGSYTGASYWNLGMLEGTSTTAGASIPSIGNINEVCYLQCGDDYVTLSAPEQFTLSLPRYFCMFSVDKVNWNWAASTYTVTSNSQNEIYLKTAARSKCSESGSAYSLVCQGGGGKIKVSGKIESLVGHNCNASDLFNGCTTLYDASELQLSELGVGIGCMRMFYGCSNLEKPPVIPSGHAFDSQYEYLFYNCSKLVNPPSLANITSMSPRAFAYAFYNCLSLTTFAGKMPQVDFIPAYAYYGMFRGDTKLTEAVELFATEYQYYACYSMYYQCTGIKFATPIHADKLGGYACGYMYYGCTGLDAPAIFAKPLTILRDRCFYAMYQATNMVFTSTAVPGETITWSIPFQVGPESFYGFDAFYTMFSGGTPPKWSQWSGTAYCNTQYNISTRYSPRPY